MIRRFSQVQHALRPTVPQRRALPPLADPRLRELFGKIPRETFGINFDVLDRRFLGEPLPGGGYATPTYIAEARKFRRSGVVPEVVAVDLNDTLVCGRLSEHFEEFLRQTGVGYFSVPFQEEQRLRRADFIAFRHLRTRILEGKTPARAAELVQYFLNGVRGEEAFNTPVTFFEQPVLQLLQQHKAAGRLIVLMSGAPYCLLEGVAPLVGADFVLGSRLKVSGGVMTAENELPLSFHLGDAALLYAFLDEAGSDTDHLWCYANNPVTDFPVLLMPSCRERAVAVNSVWKMDAVLEKTQTQTLRFASLVPGIFHTVSGKAVETARRQAVTRLAEKFRNSMA